MYPPLDFSYISGMPTTSPSSVPYVVGVDPASGGDIGVTSLSGTVYRSLYAYYDRSEADALAARLKAFLRTSGGRAAYLDSGLYGQDAAVLSCFLFTVPLDEVPLWLGVDDAGLVGMLWHRGPEPLGTPMFLGTPRFLGFYRAVLAYRLETAP